MQHSQIPEMEDTKDSGPEVEDDLSTRRMEAEARYLLWAKHRLVPCWVDPSSTIPGRVPPLKASLNSRWPPEGLNGLC